MATGWTWEYVWENMTFQRLESMSKVWKKIPPHHISTAKIYNLFAAWLGVKDKSQKSDFVPPPFINMPDIEE